MILIMQKVGGMMYLITMYQEKDKLLTEIKSVVVGGKVMADALEQYWCTKCNSHKATVKHVEEIKKPEQLFGKDFYV